MGRLMQKKKEQDIEEYYGELGHAFKFTYGDLESNRAGFTTHRQKQWARSHYLVYFLLSIPLVACITPLGFMMMLQFPNFRNNPFMSVTSLIVCALIAIICTFGALLIGYGMLRLSYEIWSDLHNGRVKTLSIEDYRKQKKSRGPLQVNVVEEAPLPDDPKTQLYLMPHSLRILSVEEVLPE
jgi:hypothetical protein